MEMVTEVVAPSPGLVAALEQATLMAKQLPTTTDPTQLLQIYTSLHSAHHHLSSFLSLSHHQSPPPLPPHPLENSVSSANIDAEPMQFGDEDENENENEAEVGEERSSRSRIEKVEEKMRDCFIRNKRPKRAISPSALAAEQRWSFDGGFAREFPGYDPHATRLRSLDLVYQFHG